VRIRRVTSRPLFQTLRATSSGLVVVNPLILVVLLWTSGSGTWIIGHLILMYIHESAIANTPLTINGARSLPGGSWSHIRHTPFLDTCFLIFLVTVFAAWLASDFVPTLYKLKRWPGLTIPPLLVTCVMLMMSNTYRLSNTSFFTAPIHTWSFSKGLMLPYFLPQASTMFWAKETTSFIPPFMHWYFFMSRLAVALLDWRPFSCNPL